MSPGLGEAPPPGPEVTTLYCSPDGRVTTPGALALAARNASPDWAAGAAAAGWAATGPARRAAMRARAIRRMAVAYTDLTAGIGRGCAHPNGCHPGKRAALVRDP